ncbi:MAG: hypothetical protein JXB49_22045 [Bacteroidales bacterium]|nr:hypothetical protein [Bacteroidales bacterium]
MFDNNLDTELQLAKRQNQAFEKYRDGATKIVKELHSVFERLNIQKEEIFDNSFKFSFWGLNWIVKTEITVKQETGYFNEGELNTYLMKEDDLEFLLSYKFDSLGNIADRFLSNDFGLHYYTDFVKSVVGYSIKKNFKFQLNSTLTD